MRLAKYLTRGARSGTISDEAIVGEFEAITDLKGFASGSESIGVTKELHSAWNVWVLVLEEVAGDKVECKRSTQLNLAGMDFKRKKLYVLAFPHPDTEPLKDVQRESPLEYFHVRPNLARA